MQDLGITDESHFESMAERASDGLDECQVPLDKDKIVEIYRITLPAVLPDCNGYLQHPVLIEKELVECCPHTWRTATWACPA